MKDKYIIISKTTLEKRIEEMERKLKQHHEWCQKTGNVYDYQYEANILELKQILSQSTPLIPEIEKAFESGVDSLQDNLIQKLGLTYQTNEVSSATVSSTRGNLEYYISNLKLDI